MKTEEIKKECTGITQMALYGVEMPDGGDLRAVLRAGIGNQYVVIIDDASERPYNEEWTICLIADLVCADGTLRVAYYHDGGLDVLHECAGYTTCQEWAEAWDDSDGVVPRFVGRDDVNDDMEAQ